MSTWDDYFALGEEFVAKVPDTAWYDSSGGRRPGDAQPGRVPLRDRRQHRRRRQRRAAGRLRRPSPATSTQGCRPSLAQWSDDWTASFQNDGFATMACPGWMLGVVEGNAEGVKGWDFADVFPGGGGNWGGSFLTVPAQGDNTRRRTEVAAWLTAPEQQAKAFEANGTFPSQVEALDAPEVVERLQRVLQRRTGRRDPRQPRRGRDRPALQGSEVLRHPAGRSRPRSLRVDDGSQTPTSRGSQFLTDVEALG